ncbi:MNIO family bufferin maturase [Caulobacter sp. LjRoot300]|uniref:MNIO family bufferin maturase n=1 Tax=Caulobacter sp. LjRoot300 TaxID=3342321 RepID=UPI003ECC90E6
MPPTAGLGLKSQHYADALAAEDEGLWFEVHPENYMAAGGPRLRALEAIRRQHPLSLHGVGLSLAADADLAPAHLAALKALADRFEPFVVSEHLAWSAWRGVHQPDLLPFPRTRAALDRIAGNIGRTQDALGRTILVENPSLYLPLTGHDYEETEFLGQLARRTGCGLLVDVNNVFVSASNLGYAAEAYLDALPAEAIGEIHLAGHGADEGGSTLLIDTHGAPVAEAVWTLYRRLVDRIGTRPTLIERDDDIPAFAALMAERDRAHGMLTGTPLGTGARAGPQPLPAEPTHV